MNRREAGSLPGFRRLFVRLSSAVSSGGAGLAWTGLAVALIPPFEFIQRGLYGGEVASAIVAGILLCGTALACLLALPAGWTAGGGAAGWWLAAMLIAAGLSAAANGAVLEALPVVAVLVTGAAGFLLHAGLAGRARVSASRAFAIGLATGGALAGLYALIQSQAGIEVPVEGMAALRAMDPGLAARVQARIAEHRSFAFFLYPSALAGYLVIALPFALEGWLGRSPGRWRLGWAAAAVIIALGLLASGSLGAAGALLAAVVITGIRMRSPRKGLAIGALVLFAAVLAWRRPDAFASGMDMKLTHWRCILARTPSFSEGLVGRGPGSYGAVAAKAMPPAAWSRYAHDWPIETWVEQGLLGLVPLLGFLVVGLSGWRRVTSGPREPWTWAVAVGWIAGLIHSLADFDYALPAVAFPWWCLTGWLVATALPARAGVSRVLERAWTRTTAAIVSLSRVALPSLPPLLILPLVLLRGTPAVLWEGAVLGLAVAVFWAARLMRRIAPVAGRADLPWVILLVLGGGWALFSSRPDASYTACLVAAGLVAAIFLLRALARADQRVEPAMRWSVLGLAAVIGLWGIGEAAFRREPACASFPSPNFLGAFLVFTGGLALGSVREAKEKARIILGGILAIMVAGVAATHSAGAGLAACAVTGTWLAGFVVRGRGGRRLWAFGGVAACILVASWGASRVDAISLVQRLTMWHEAIHLISDAPGGWGPGSYKDVVLRVQEPSITVAGVGRYSLVAEFAHCEPLQFAAEWGIAGLGILAWGLILSWRAASRGATSAWRLALAGVLVHGLVDFPLRAPPILLLGMVALAFMSVRVRPATSAAGGRATAAGAAVCLLLAAWLGTTWLRPALSRWALENAVSAEPRNVVSLRTAMGAWPLAMTGESPEPGACWWARVAVARERMERRDWRGAEAAISEALAREPFCVDAYVSRGRLAEKRGDRPTAKRWYRQALLLRARLIQRPGLNDYEKALVGFSAEWERRVRGLLLNAGGER